MKGDLSVGILKAAMLLDNTFSTEANCRLFLTVQSTDLYTLR